MKEDKNFGNCHRCQGAWDRWSGLGAPGKGDRNMRHPAKAQFKKDMPSDQAGIQVIDFTGFFKLDADEPVVDTDMIKYLEPYLEAVRSEDPDVSDLPEELQESAKDGVDVLLVNDSVGQDIRDAEAKTKRKWEKRASNKKEEEYGKEGPTMFPDKFLLYIQRDVDQSKEFSVPGSDRPRYGRKYNVEFLTPDELGDDWPLDHDEAFEIAASNCRDLRNPKLDTEDLKERASLLDYLTKEEMQEFLEEMDHSFGPETVSAPEQDTSTAMSPDDFADVESPVVADEEGQRAIKEAEAKLRAGK